MASLQKIDQDVLQCFAFWAAVVLLKTIFMSLFTTIHRISKQVFSTPEDYKLMGKQPHFTKDPFIERIRSCQLNDLENVIPFILIGTLYLAIVPDAGWAKTYFRLFGVSRLIHSIAYLGQIQQPARSLAYIVGLTVNFMMVLSVLSVLAW